MSDLFIGVLLAVESALRSLDSTHEQHSQLCPICLRIMDTFGLFLVDFLDYLGYLIDLKVTYISFVCPCTCHPTRYAFCISLC